LTGEARGGRAFLKEGATSRVCTLQRLADGPVPLTWSHELSMREDGGGWFEGIGSCFETAGSPSDDAALPFQVSMFHARHAAPCRTITVPPIE